MSWWCKGSTLFRHVRGLGSIPVSGLCFLLIFLVLTLCLPCYSSLLSECTIKRGFAIDLCCTSVVFTMSFIFVKRMYS